MLIFGSDVGNSCSTYQSGDLTKTDRAIDGIFGFGQQDLSVISQLSSQGIIPKVFSHCIKEDGNGGGKLVLGDILDPNIAYSPIVSSQYVLYTILLVVADVFMDNVALCDSWKLRNIACLGFDTIQLYHLHFTHAIPFSHVVKLDSFVCVCV